MGLSSEGTPSSAPQTHAPEALDPVSLGPLGAQGDLSLERGRWSWGHQGSGGASASPSPQRLEEEAPSSFTDLFVVSAGLGVVMWVRPAPRNARTWVRGKEGAQS